MGSFEFIRRLTCKASVYEVDTGRYLRELRRLRKSYCEKKEEQGTSGMKDPAQKKEVLNRESYHK